MLRKNPAMMYIICIYMVPMRMSCITFKIQYHKMSTNSGFDLFCCGIAWWRHRMEIFFALPTHCAGNSPITSEGRWSGALMFSLICAWINGWVNNREAGDFRCYHAHYDVIVLVPGHCTHVLQDYLSGNVTIALPSVSEAILYAAPKYCARKVWKYGHLETPICSICNMLIVRAQ